jgi:hypothetical protein
MDSEEILRAKDLPIEAGQQQGSGSSNQKYYHSASRAR